MKSYGSFVSNFQFNNRNLSKQVKSMGNGNLSKLLLSVELHKMPPLKKSL